MLAATDLRKSFVLERTPFGRRRRSMVAVDGVSLQVERGQTVAVVGESGCGKSTTAELILQLQRADEGSVMLDGQELTTLSTKALRPIRRRVQAVFQDPYSSLDPTQTIGSSLSEVLAIHGLGDSARRRCRAVEALEQVGLPTGRADLDRYPAEFSGGQRQRIAIARALVVDPDFVVLDEAVSALDVSTQAQVLNLLVDLQRERGLGYLFISHDLGVVHQIATVIAVMYLGRIVEMGPAGVVYERPRHPYTRALLESVPEPDPQLQRQRRAARTAVGGEPPDPADRPSGCAFHPRCPFAEPRCTIDDPTLRSVDGREVACHLADDVVSVDVADRRGR